MASIPFDPYQALIASRMTGLGAQPMTTGVQPIDPRIATVPSMSAGVPEGLVSRAQAVLRESKSATVDPRIAAMFDRQAKQYDAQEAQIAETTKMKPSDYLLRVAAAMAENRSPRFAQALTSGLLAGNEEIDRRKQEAARQRAAITQGRDELTVKRIAEERAARQELAAQTTAMYDLADKIGGVEGKAIENETKRIVAQNAPQEAALKIKGLIADLEVKGANVNQSNASAAASLASAAKTRADMRGGGSGTKKAPQGAVGTLNRAAAELAAARAEYEADRKANVYESQMTPETIKRYRDAKAKFDTLNGAFSQSYGYSPFRVPQAAVPVAPPAGAGELIYDPKTGKLTPVGSR